MIKKLLAGASLFAVAAAAPVTVTETGIKSNGLCARATCCDQDIATCVIFPNPPLEHRYDLGGPGQCPPGP